MEAVISELGESLPAGLISSVEGPEDGAPLALYRFLRPGQPDLLWAPRGLLLVGRKSELVHWVPPSPPQNLSGRHLAFLRARGAALRVVDLGSTNGTYVDGRELRAFERVLLALPNVVEIGTEGTLRIDLRQAPIAF
ncbi:MAG: FHA domain-containing protein [bacterium]|nr:FHA domain-containing protein [bacterium]